MIEFFSNKDDCKLMDREKILRNCEFYKVARLFPTDQY